MPLTAASGHNLPSALQKKRRSWLSGRPLRRSARSRTRGTPDPRQERELVAGRAAYNQVKEFSAYALRLLGTHCCV